MNLTLGHLNGTGDGNSTMSLEYNAGNNAALRLASES